MYVCVCVILNNNIFINIIDFFFINRNEVNGDPCDFMFLLKKFLNVFSYI